MARMATTTAAARPTARQRREILSRLTFASVVAAVTLDMIMVETADGGVIMVETVEGGVIMLEIADEGKETALVVLDSTDTDMLSDGVETLGKRSKSSFTLPPGTTF